MAIQTKWWLQLRRLLCLHEHVTTTRPKSAFWGIFETNATLTPKSNAFILAPNPSVVKVQALEISLVAKSRGRSSNT